MSTARAIHDEGYKPQVELGSANGIGDFAELRALEAMYPSSDGEPMADHQYQDDAIRFVQTRLEQWARDKPSVYVGANSFVYPEEGTRDNRKAPNVFVALNVTNPDLTRYIGKWLTWRERGKAPDFIIEVAAQSTWRVDAGKKRAIYAEWGVQEYWRFNAMPDPYFEIDAPVLEGDRLVGGQYERIEIEKDETGILKGYSKVLDLHMYAHGDRELRMWDPKRGEWLRKSEESEDALEEANDEIQRLRDRLAQEGIEI